jgi:hypothetical protein
MHSTLAPILAVALINLAATAQELTWKREGSPPQPYILLTELVAPLHDVDLDGYEDLMVGVSGIYPYGGKWLLSGRDGSVLRIKTWFSFEESSGTFTSAGDMDGDGRGDYASVVWPTDFITNTWTRLEVRSTWDDRLIWQAPGAGSTLDLFGAYNNTIVGDLDLDGDRLPDVLVSAQRADSYLGAIYAYDHRGALLRKISHPGLTFLGRSLAKLGDIDGDGCDDFVAGAFDVAAGVGIAAVFSGRTGAILVKGFGDSDGALGYTVSGAGDLDRDGVPDFVAGTAGSFGERGTVRAFSGASGAPLFTWYAPTSFQFSNTWGSYIAAGHDLDRDGVPDVMINGGPSATGIQPRGALMIYSGRDGQLLSALRDPDGLNPGIPMMLGPQPGSPFAVFATANPGYRGGGSYELGRITLYRGAVARVGAYGTACRGSLAAPPQIGIRDVAGSSTRVHLSNAPPGASALLLLGLSRTAWGSLVLPFPLGHLGFTGCQLQAAPEFIIPTTTGTSGIGAGYGFVDLPFPVRYEVSSIPVYGQWLCVGAGPQAPGALSEPLEWWHWRF